MELNIRGSKVAITEAMKSQIEEKLSRIDKYFENPESITAHVNIKVDKLSQIIEVTIPTKKFTLRAEESHEDLYSAIDLVVDKLERQIRKNKTRLNDKYKNLDVLEFNLNFDVNEDEVDDKKIVNETYG